MMEWNDSTHGIQPGTNFKQVHAVDYLRAMECVNAMVGIENPEDFITIARVNHNTVIAWEKTMMTHLGEDGIGSVVDAINKMKAEINTLKSKRSESLHSITATDRENLCDMLWWMRGYKKGADDNFNTCPFDQDHLDTLDKVVRSLREVLNNKNGNKSTAGS